MMSFVLGEYVNVLGATFILKIIRQKFSLFASITQLNIDSNNTIIGFRKSMPGRREKNPNSRKGEKLWIGTLRTFILRISTKDRTLIRVKDDS